MTVWKSPIPYRLIPTTDSDSFKTMAGFTTGLPLPPHVGSFGFNRRNHTHEGVDLYCPTGTPVCAVEDGRVVAVVPFSESSIMRADEAGCADRTRFSLR